MPTKRSYNNAILNEDNTDSQRKNTVLYDYKKRREELNKLVKNHIAKQQQCLTQKNTAIAK